MGRLTPIHFEKIFAKMDFDGYGLGGAFLKKSGDIYAGVVEELPEIQATTSFRAVPIQTIS